MKKKPILLLIGILVLAGVVFAVVYYRNTSELDARDYAERRQSKRGQVDI